MSRHSKRWKTIHEKHDRTQLYDFDFALKGVKEGATAKFDETVELAFLLGVDPRHADQQVRGSVSLPHGTGKDLRVIAFCKSSDQIEAAKAAGAVEAGAEDLVKRVSEGWLDFDAAVASPDMMAQVGKLGRVLGPRGLMPSPKAGTVTPDVGKAVEEIQKGKIEYRVDKNANLHVPVGKASFTIEQLTENAGAVISAVVKARPSACKGTYLKSCAISSTMGPGFRLDPTSIQGQFR
jgi:large subunit ribosomal protein L1